MADSPHILKNIRNFLISKQTLTLPPEIVLKYLLPSNSVCVDVVKKLFTEEIKVGKGLSNTMLEPGQYDNMKVALAQ